MAGATWNCCHLVTFCVHHTTIHHVTSSKATYVRCMRVYLQPALLAEWPGSFTCYCGNTGWNGYQNKSQHRKLTLEKKILPLLLQRSNHWAIPIPLLLFSLCWRPTCVFAVLVVPFNKFIFTKFVAKGFYCTDSLLSSYCTVSSKPALTSP